MQKTILSIMLVFAFISTNAFAGPHGHHAGKVGAIKALELSDEQKTILADALDTYSEDLAAYHENLATAMTLLNDAILAGIENDIRLASTDVAAIKVEIHVIKATVLQELINVLTDDQYDILLEKYQERNEAIVAHRDKIIEFMEKLIGKHGSTEDAEEE